MDHPQGDDAGARNVFRLPVTHFGPDAPPAASAVAPADPRPGDADDRGLDLTDPDDSAGMPPGAPPLPPTSAELTEQAVRVAVGAVAATAAVIAQALRATMPPPDPEAPTGPDPIALFSGAGLGLTLRLGERVARFSGDAVRAVSPPLSWVTGAWPFRAVRDLTGVTLRDLDEQWTRERPDADRAAASFVGELAPSITDAVLDHLSLTDIVLERVDLNRIVAAVDIDAVLDRVDLDAVVEKVDLQRIVDRIDLNEVAAGLDVNAVAERVDVEALIEKLDLAGIAQEVIEEIDLPEIIRSSTGTMASETVRGLRVQSVEVDRAIARAVDRVIFRRKQRRTDAPGTAPSELAPTEEGEERPTTDPNEGDGEAT
jgi:hypothetical protein